MKSASIWAPVISLALLWALPLSAQNASNPIEVALLRWYSVNTAAQFGSAAPYSVCSHPNGMVFDGAHIWVACPPANTVQEFNANDGTFVRAVSLGSGVQPYYVLFDGANIWTANYGTNSLTKIDASTGAILSSVPVGTEPTGMAYDGQYIWVANSGSNVITQVPTSGGTPTPYMLGNNCVYPWGVVFDGVHVWVSCHEDNTVVMLVAGAIASTVCVGPYPSFMAFDGTNIWVSNSTSAGTVSVFSINSPPACPTRASSVTVGSYPEGIAFDTEYIWVANSSDNTVTKVQASTLAVVGTYPTPTQPWFVTFDGGNIWISARAGGVLGKM